VDPVRTNKSPPLHPGRGFALGEGQPDATGMASIPSDAQGEGCGPGREQPHPQRRQGWQGRAGQVGRQGRAVQAGQGSQGRVGRAGQGRGGPSLLPGLSLPSRRGTWDQPKFACFYRLIYLLGGANNVLLGQIRLPSALDTLFFPLHQAVSP